MFFLAQDTLTVLSRTVAALQEQQLDRRGPAGPCWEAERRLAGMLAQALCSGPRDPSAAQCWRVEEFRDKKGTGTRAQVPQNPAGAKSWGLGRGDTWPGGPTLLYLSCTRFLLCLRNINN